MVINLLRKSKSRELLKRSAEELAKVQDDLKGKEQIISDLVDQIEQLKTIIAPPQALSPLISPNSIAEENFGKQVEPAITRKASNPEFSHKTANGRSRTPSVLFENEKHFGRRPSINDIKDLHPYESIRDGLVGDLDPNHLQVYLSEEDCRNWLGLSREWLDWIHQSELDSVKVRAGLSAHQYGLARTSHLSSDSRKQSSIPSSPIAMTKVKMLSEESNPSIKVCKD